MNTKYRKRSVKVLIINERQEKNKRWAQSNRVLRLPTEHTSYLNIWTFEQATLIGVPFNVNDHKKWQNLLEIWQYLNTLFKKQLTR